MKKFIHWFRFEMPEWLVAAVWVIAILLLFSSPLAALHRAWTFSNTPEHSEATKYQCLDSVVLPEAGVVYECPANTEAAINTQSETSGPIFLCLCKSKEVICENL